MPIFDCEPDPVERLAQLLAAGPLLRRALVLVPDRAQLLPLRERLSRQSGDLLRGVYFFTPQSFRDELVAAGNFLGQTLPARHLLPLQIRNRRGSAWPQELCRLRPQERDKLFPENPLALAEKKGFYSEAALEWALLASPAANRWDLACSLGFFEGDWDHWAILQLLSRCAKRICHFFRPMANLPAIRRWRKCWSYETVRENSYPIPQARHSLFHVADWNSATELIGRRLLKIAERDPSQPVAVVFSHAHGYFRAVRELLRRIRIPFLDLLGRADGSRITSFQWNWLRYQRRPKRRECRELLHAFAAENGWTYDALAEGEDTIADHCRKKLCDDCSAIPDLPWNVLPDRATAAALLQAACQVVPDWEPLRDRLPALIALCEELSREEFLSWLEQELRNFQRQEQAEPVNLHAPVHLVSYGDVAENFYDHLILADTAEEDFSTAPGELLDAEVCARLNGELKDFYYLSPKEKSAMRDGLLRRCFSTAQHCEGIFVESDNILIGRNLRSLAPAMVNHFQNDTFTANGEILLEISAMKRDDFPPVEKTVTAHRARRNPNRAFGAYDFGFGENLWGVEEWSAAIPCKAWERILKAPEESWLEQVLHLPIRTNAIREDLPQLLGTAVHRSLADYLAGKNTASAVPNGPRSTLAWSLDLQIAGAVEDLIVQVEELRKNFRPLGESYETALRGTIPVVGNELELHGRADWLLRDASGRTLAVDFKTGSSAVALTAHRVCEGDFLQLALYGRIVEQLDGPCTIGALFPFSRGKWLSMEELSENLGGEIFAAWERFARLWQSLNFGYRIQKERKFLAFAHGPIPDHIIASRLCASGFNPNGEEEP
ncbi:MAG: PD-(D/E)XK nuclease family protein [Puniceicoccales bacterium]|nr:PD-(D/E)XK nuclease family protein [Puniceicoccales bacterium]